MNNTLKISGVSLLLLVFLCSICPVGASGPVDTEPGYYVVHWYNYDGADVSFDGEYRGSINDSELLVEVDPAAPPYSRYSISKEGHATFTGYIDSVPEPGEIIDLHPRNVQIELAEPEWDDSGRGWYVVHETTDGSSVYFDRAYMGEVTDGTLRVEVNLSEPAFTEYRVVKPDGWTSHTIKVQQVPPPGGTVHYYSWVQPAPCPPPRMRCGPDTPTPASPAPAGNGGVDVNDNGVETPGFQPSMAIFSFGILFLSWRINRTGMRTP